LRSWKGYPNPWIEAPIFIHLPGNGPKDAYSRNILNVASTDIVVVLPGGDGTQAELELELELELALALGATSNRATTWPVQHIRRWDWR